MLMDFQGKEWMTSPWLKKILKFTGLKCPQIEGFSWRGVTLPCLKKFLKITVQKHPNIDGFSREKMNDFTMVEENFEIISSKMPRD